MRPDMTLLPAITSHSSNTPIPHHETSIPAHFDILTAPHHPDTLISDLLGDAHQSLLQLQGNNYTFSPRPIIAQAIREVHARLEALMPYILLAGDDRAPKVLSIADNTLQAAEHNRIKPATMMAINSFFSTKADTQALYIHRRDMIAQTLLRLYHILHRIHHSFQKGTALEHLIDADMMTAMRESIATIQESRAIALRISDESAQHIRIALSLFGHVIGDMDRGSVCTPRTQALVDHYLMESVPVGATIQ